MGLRFYKALVCDNMKGRQTKFLLNHHDISEKSGKSKNTGMHGLLCCCCSVDKSCSTLSETAMAPHSSTFAWKSPWMEEPGRLQSTGSLRVGHD